MNKNQIEGRAKKVVGKIQQKVGEATGSTNQQMKGAARQVEGQFQKGVGDVEQAVDDSVKQSRNKP